MTSRRIAVFTSTRAEYGLLRPLMREIAGRPGLTLQVIASGTHLSPQHGMTVREIEADGFAVDAAQEVLGEFVTEASDIGVTPFSSLRRTGVEDVAETLRAWVDAAPERVEFELPPPSADGDVPLDESPQG